MDMPHQGRCCRTHGQAPQRRGMLCHAVCPCVPRCFHRRVLVAHLAADLGPCWDLTRLSCEERCLGDPTLEEGRSVGPEGCGASLQRAWAVVAPCRDYPARLRRHSAMPWAAPFCLGRRRDMCPVLPWVACPCHRTSHTPRGSRCMEAACRIRATQLLRAVPYSRAKEVGA